LSSATRVLPGFEFRGDGTRVGVRPGSGTDLFRRRGDHFEQVHIGEFGQGQAGAGDRAADVAKQRPFQQCLGHERQSTEPPRRWAATNGHNDRIRTSTEDHGIRIARGGGGARFRFPRTA
jgi:hypothetical protein